MTFKVTSHSYRLVFAFFAIAMLIVPLNNFNAHAVVPTSIYNESPQFNTSGGATTTVISNFVVASSDVHTITLVGISIDDNPGATVSSVKWGDGATCSTNVYNFINGGMDESYQPGGTGTRVYTSIWHSALEDPGFIPAGTHNLCVTYTSAAHTATVGAVTFHNVASAVAPNPDKDGGTSTVSSITIPGVSSSSVIFAADQFHSASATPSTAQVSLWNVKTQGTYGSAGYSHLTCGNSVLQWSSSNGNPWAISAYELLAVDTSGDAACPSIVIDNPQPNPVIITQGDTSTGLTVDLHYGGSCTSAITLSISSVSGVSPTPDPLPGAITLTSPTGPISYTTNPRTEPITLGFDPSISPGFYTVHLHADSTCGTSDLDIPVDISPPVIPSVPSPGVSQCTAGNIVTLSATDAGDSVWFTLDGTDPKTSGTAIQFGPGQLPQDVQIDHSTIIAVEVNLLISDGPTFGPEVSSHCAIGSEHRPAYPSLSGGYFNDIPDPFTFNGVPFTVKGFVIDPPTQDLIINTDQTLVFKTYSVSGYGELLTHFGLYLGPHPADNIGKMAVGIVWDRDTGVTTVDPLGLISHVAVSEVKKNNQDEFTIHFTPIKQLPVSDMILRMWNIKHSSVDYHGFNVARFTNEHLAPAQAQLPDNLIVYDNLADLNKQIQASGYVKPNILSHIHNTGSVFTDIPGKVYWLYDTVNNSVTLVMEDGNGKVVGMYPESLVKQDSTTSMSTDKTYNSLSRWNVDAMESAQSDEAVKALNKMMQMYGRNSVVQYGFLG